MLSLILCLLKSIKHKQFVVRGIFYRYVFVTTGPLEFIKCSGAPPQIRLGIVIQVNPAICRKFCATNHWKGSMHCARVLHGRICVESTGPKQASPFLGPHLQIQAGELRFASFLHIWVNHNKITPLFDQQIRITIKKCCQVISHEKLFCAHLKDRGRKSRFLDRMPICCHQHCSRDGLRTVGSVHI